MAEAPHEPSRTEQPVTSRFDPANEREEMRAFGRRLRENRLRAGLTYEQTARAAGTHHSTLLRYELGEGVPRPARLARIASALGVPVAQLVTDELILAEVRVSPETLDRVRSLGRPAAEEVARRIAANLEALLLAEATRPPVDLSKGARPKRRRTRAEVLRGVTEAKRSREAIRERERSVVHAG